MKSDHDRRPFYSVPADAYERIFGKKKLVFQDGAQIRGERDDNGCVSVGGLINEVYEPFTSDDPLQLIQDKCQQYWNERGIGVEEVHCILAWIHNKADTAMRQRDANREDTTAEEEGQAHSGGGSVQGHHP